MRLSPETLSAKADRPPFWWRKCLSMGMAAALSLSAAPAANADTYPSKTITIIVGFAPGGLIDISELIRETIALVRGDLETAGIVVQLELAAQLPLISAHKGRLQQVILNVVTNAPMRCARSRIEGGC